MTSLLFSSLFKKVKQRWLDQLHQRWEQEFLNQEQELRQAHTVRAQEVLEEYLQQEAELAKTYSQQLQAIRDSWEAKQAALKASHEEQAAVLIHELSERLDTLRQEFQSRELRIVDQSSTRLAELQREWAAREQAATQQLAEQTSTWQQRLEESTIQQKSTFQQVENKGQEELTVLAELLQEERTKLLAQQEVLASKQREVDDLQHRVDDRRKELTHVNEELKAQIRLLEAKASPDAVWVEAFSRGYEKAWDTVSPLMMSGVEKSKEAIRRVAIDQTLENLDGAIQQKAIALGQFDVREKSELMAKYEMFRQKRDAAVKPEEREKYSHYLTALEWALNGYQLSQDQALPK